MSQKPLMLPVCTSCNRPVRPAERASRFQCPNCQAVPLWRCEMCRKFSRTYRCVNCGFEGP